MNRSHYRQFTFIVWMICTFWIVGQTPMLTPESVVEMKEVSHVAMQPQGQFIAYTLKVARSADEEPGKDYSELWVVPAHSGDARAYVQKPHSVSDIAWTPDGTRITFLDKREAYNPYKQVYAIPVDGGEAQQISHAPRSISDYAYSPDGNLLAYSYRDKEPEKKRAAKERGYDQIVDGTWTTVTRIHIENLQTGESHLVTRGEEHVWEFNWTPDGKHIIYRASKRPFIDDKYMFSDNYMVPAEGGSGEKIADTDGKLGLATMSPDGRHFAWLGAVDFHDPYTHGLFVMHQEGQSVKNLLRDYRGTAETFAWLDNRTILIEMIENTHKYLYKIDIEDGKMTQVIGGKGPIFSEISLNADKKQFAALANVYNHPDEVFLGSLTGKPLVRLTNCNPEFERMEFGEQETITWEGPDGWNISGILVKPVDYEAGNRYPLQVQVHGGPEGVRLDGWNTYYNRPVQMLAQRGIIVLLPNYRGSIGEGVAFSKGDHQDLMGKEFEDILAGIDHLNRRGLIDPARVGIGGGSYGGYASAWAATRHSERFAVAVVFVGIGNQISKAGMTDIPVENAEVHWNLWLYDNYELVWDRSPIKHIKNANTPTLILHGEEDERVPLNQAYELYRALKYVNVPTELVVYPREGHGNKERAHRIDLSSRALEWYERYLKEGAATVQ